MRPTRLLLQGILDSIDEILSTTPASKDEFDANKLMQSHVLRHIQIIGEAASRLPAELKQSCPRIPWRQIIGMRHVLVHDYFEVNWDRVYETARESVPALKPQIRDIFNSLPPDTNEAD